MVIPIENHFEQEANARRFSEKYGFAVLKYSALSASSLVSSVEKVIDKKYKPEIFGGGAGRAAELILKLISEQSNWKKQNP